jgi:hypothetical protein
MSDRIYRLDIAYPEGSREEGWQPPGWKPGDPFTHYDFPEDEGTFRWPVERDYLSASGANARAARLRKCGCIVEVDRSERVVWDAPETEPEPTADDWHWLAERIKAYPRRELVEALAEAMSHVEGDAGNGSGMWWYQARAYSLVEAMPKLALVPEPLSASQVARLDETDPYEDAIAIDTKGRT